MSRFILPADMSEALAALAGGARPVAGGTDLMVKLRHAALEGGELPQAIMDVTRLPELNRLELTGQRPFVGAAVTYARLQQEPETARLYPLLVQAASVVGSPQVRQSGTLGGNAANSSPAADGVSALTALSARVLLASTRGEREILLQDMITAPGKNTMEPGELIVGFYLDRLPAGTSQTYAKVGRRQAVAVSRLNVAVCLDRDITDPRVVLGACFPSPRRLADVEALIKAGQPGPELWLEAGRMAASQFVNVCGWRSSAPYKVPAVTHFLAAALTRCWEARGGAQ